MKKLKILFVAEHYPPHIGGVETFFFELRKRLVARGHEVNVVTCAEMDAPREEKDAGGTIYRVGGNQHSFTFLAIPLVMKLAAQADIIHATLYNAALPAFVAAKIHGKKSVLSVHEVLGRDFLHVTGGRPFKASVFMFLEKILLSLPFDKYIAVSKATREKLRGGILKKSDVIYHGIDEEFKTHKRHVQSIQNQKLIEFLYFGRIAANKGIWFLLESLKDFYSFQSDRSSEKRILPNSCVKFKLLLSGGEKDFAEVEKILSARLRNGVQLADFVSVKRSVPRADLAAEIAAADAVIVPSLAEGFGFTAAEAMAIGVPVVLSDAGSLPEIAGGKHLIFKSGDKAALIEALKKAAAGEWMETSAKDFSWDKAAAEFERLYLSLF